MAAAVTLRAEVDAWSDPTDRTDYAAQLAMAYAERELDAALRDVDVAEAALVTATTRAVDARERLGAALVLVAGGLRRLASLRGGR